MIIQIKRIIQEGYSYGDLLENLNANQVRETFNNRGNVAERVGAALNTVPITNIVTAPVSNMVAGYQVGKDVGHPVVGTIGGREAAIGAASKNVSGLSIKDVYTPKNMLNKALIGAGAIGGLYAVDELMAPEDHTFMGDDDLGKTQKVNTGVIGATVAAMPAVRYGFGKVFGRRNSKK